jgi:hypothetical protein
MKLKAVLFAVMIGLAPFAHTAVVDPAEPPATPAGGAPETGISAGAAVGIAVIIGVIVAIAAGGGGDDNNNANTGTGGGTGTL